MASSSRDEHARLLPREEQLNHRSTHNHGGPASNGTGGGRLPSRVGGGVSAGGSVASLGTGTGRLSVSTHQKAHYPLDHPRGWIIVTASFLVQLAVFGLIAAFPVFVKEMHTDPSIGSPPKPQLSLVNSIASGPGLWLGAFGGYVVDRFGPRVLLVATTLALTFAMLVPTFVCHSIEAMIFLYSIPIAFASGMANSPCASAVGSWFDAKLPIAMGISSAGGGLGNAVIPLAAGLLADSNQGWRSSFRFLSLFSLCSLIGAILISRRVPPVKHHGLSTWGAVKRDMRHAFKHVRTKPFLICCIFGFTFGFTFFGMMYVFVPLATAYGATGPYSYYQPISTAKASSLFVWDGVAQIIGSILLGVVAYVVDSQSVYVLSCIFGGLAAFGLALSPTYTYLAISATVFGFATAGNWTLFPTFIVGHFAGPVLGVVMGLAFASIGLGGLVGPPVISLIASHNNDDYTASLILTGTLNIGGGALCFFFMPPPDPEALNDNIPHPDFSDTHSHRSFSHWSAAILEHDDVHDDSSGDGTVEAGIDANGRRRGLHPDDSRDDLCSEEGDA